MSTASKEISVIETGTSNLASVCSALQRAGAHPQVTSDRQVIARAERIVIPGVGAFASAMRRLAENDLIELLRERIESRVPTLAICIGFQMLFMGSEESPGVAGLALIESYASRFPQSVSVPQMGWNKVEPEPGCALLKPGYAYFANSYCVRKSFRGWDKAYTEHATRFISAVERGPILACQFHPELSGDWGQELINRWLELAD